jgi:hypothetical protein
MAEPDASTAVNLTLQKLRTGRDWEWVGEITFLRTC